MPQELKVVFIGAASPQWSYKISRDIIMVLSDERICGHYDPVLVMEDVDSVALEPMARLAEKTAEKAGGKVRILSTINQKKALTGAQYVVVSIGVGTLEAMQYDVEIPQHYGIYMPVGDTASIGGAIRGARNIPAMLSIARDMQEVSHPDAWILNLTNPMSILCRALTRETSVNTLGLCHELYGGLRFLAPKLGFDNTRWRDVTRFDILGINHCGWMQNLNVGDKDGFALLRDYLAERGITEEVTHVYNSSFPDLTRDTVKINLFLRHGILPYSGDRHTVEFFSEFVNSNTNKGADFGVLITSPRERLVQWRGGARTDTLEYLNGKKDISLEKSEEAVSRIIRAFLIEEEPLFDVSNLPYYGDELPGVPDGAVLERLATYTKDGIEPKTAVKLPALIHEHLVLMTNIIEDYVEAAISGNRRILIEALERDPLLRNMEKTKIPELLGTLLDVHKESVHPGFF